MQNMYTNRVTRGDGSTFSCGKGRESSMTTSSSFKGRCDERNTPGHKKARCFKFLREYGGVVLPSSGAARSGWCSLHNTHLHDNADCRAQDTVVTADASATPVATTTTATAKGTFMAAITRAE